MQMKRHGFSFRLEFAQRLFGLFLFFAWAAGQSTWEAEREGHSRAVHDQCPHCTKYTQYKPKPFSNPSSHCSGLDQFNSSILMYE